MTDYSRFQSAAAGVQIAAAQSRLAGTARPFKDVLAQRLGELQRSASMEISPRRAMGEVTVVGAGEASVDVNFPVWFTEKPSFSFGGELAEGHSPEATNFPTISVMVLSWVTEERGYTIYYVGAKLGIVTTGVASHSVIAHWAAEGKAMQNPRSNIPGLDDQF